MGVGVGWTVEVLGCVDYEAISTMIWRPVPISALNMRFGLDSQTRKLSIMGTERAKVLQQFSQVVGFSHS